MADEKYFHGELARLIPILPDSKREQKSTSIFLAGLRSVFELRQVLLGSIGVRVGTSASMEAWTEVTFDLDKKAKLKKTKDEKDSRPDGLMVLRTGRREWRALIEAKVGNDEVGEEQLLRYIAKAKEQGIDAVITITNQLTAIPTHHPVKLPKTVTNKIPVFHWSWAFIRTQCQLLLNNDNVEDQDQIFILEEIFRYFSSDRSGISDFNEMNKEWGDIVNKAKNEAPMSKSSDEVMNTVFAWHQEQKDLCLKLSQETGSAITLRLRPAYRSDPARRIKDDAEAFTKDYTLRSTIMITNAAADLEVEANAKTRMLYFYMRLTAPKDKKSTKARLNWLLRQLKQTQPDGFSIRAIRPGKAMTTSKTLAELRDLPELIETDTGNSTATAFDVLYGLDLAARFSGRRVFIESLEVALVHFYQEAGQVLKAWVPSAPKIEHKSQELEESLAGDADEAIAD